VVAYHSHMRVGGDSIGISGLRERVALGADLRCRAWQRRLRRASGRDGVPAD